MKEAIKTGIKIGVMIGAAHMTYAMIIAVNKAACKWSIARLEKFVKEFEAAGEVYKSMHPEVFDDNEEEVNDDDE